MRKIINGRWFPIPCPIPNCEFWHPNPAMLPFPEEPMAVAPTPEKPKAAAVATGSEPGFFKSLPLSLEDIEFVSDLNLMETKSETSNRTPNRDQDSFGFQTGDAEMANPEGDGSEDMDTDGKPNLNQSLISDYFS